MSSSRALFEQACELAPQHRERWLAQLQQSDPEMAREVSDLLQWDHKLEQEPLFLEPPTNVNADSHDLSLDPNVGTSCGSYELLECIGVGGMGSVYRARRTDGAFEKEVAVKLLHRELANPENQQRFQQEREALATLQHPGISRLLDGGATEGIPYLVMEWIRGQRIDTFCDERQLSIEDRVRIFVTICEAVEHAHRHMLVHRDLKPSNILVDETGHATLLDFGIAKLLNPEGRAITRSHVGPLTPAYASPEQLRGGVVSVATDVYSLGLILFELLTGIAPQLDSGDGVESTRRIREDPVPRASAMFSSSTTPPPGNAKRGEFALRCAARSASAAQLQQQLRGDLDAILGCALAKNVDQRYSSVGMLAADLRATLSHRSISVATDSPWKALHRFTLRHRRGVLISSLTLALLVVSGGVTLKSLWRADRDTLLAEQREVQRRIYSDLLERILFLTSPDVGAGERVTVTDILDEACRDFDEIFRRDPTSEAMLSFFVGRSYTHYGRFVTATKYLERAVALRAQEFGEEAEPTHHARLVLAITLSMVGRVDEATLLAERANAYFAGNLDSRDALAAAKSLAVVYDRGGRLDRAEEVLGPVLSRHTERVSTALARAHATYGKIQAQRGQVSVAEQHLRRAIDVYDELHPQGHTQCAFALDDLGELLARHGRAAEAEPLHQRALALNQRALGEDHAFVARSLTSLGTTYSLLRKPQRAEQYLRRAVGILEKVESAGEPLANAWVNLAASLTLQGANGEARELLQGAIALYEETLGDHPDLAVAYNNLARVHLHSGEFSAAQRGFQKSLAMTASVGGSADQRIGLNTNLARLMLRMKQPELAEPYYRRALEIAEAELPPEHRLASSCKLLLALYLLDRSDTENVREAAQLSRAAYRTRDASLGDASAGTANARAIWAYCRIQDGDAEGGGEELRAAASSLRELLGEKHKNVLRAERWLQQLRETQED